MKNPCDNCILQINCTCVCDKKINYGTLLKDAIRQGNHVKTYPGYNSLYWTYQSKYSKHRMEEIEIERRRTHYVKQ